MKTSPNKARRLPVFELRPQASHEEVVARVNALHSEARAWENLQLEGGQVHRANGNVVLALGSGSGAMGGGSSGSGVIATPSPANPPDTPSPDGTPSTPSPITGGGTTTNTGTGGNNYKDTFTEITVVSATEVGDVPAGVPAASIAMSSRIKGGVAALVGFDEFASPSTPPKKYRNKTLSGNIATGLFSNAEGTIGLAGSFGTTATLNGSGGGCTFSLTLLNGSVSASSSTGPVTYKSFLVFRIGETVPIGGWTQPTGIPGEAGTYLLKWGATNNGSWPRPSDPSHFVYLGVLGTITKGIAAEDLTYSGQITYGAATGLPTSTAAVAGALYNTTTNVVAALASTPVSSINDASSRLGLTLNATDTATTRALAAPNQVVLVESGVYRKPTASTLAESLSTEDLETDAIDRLYTVVDWSSSDPTTAVTGAQWTDRGAGYTFTFFESELSITVGSTALLALNVGDGYLLNVELWASYSDTEDQPFETHAVDVVIGAGGSASATISILPLEAGTTAIYVKSVTLSY